MYVSWYVCPPSLQKTSSLEFPEPEGVSVFNHMLVIPAGSIRARLHPHTETQDLSPMKESILPHFETQILLSKGKQASIKFLRGGTDELLISVHPPQFPGGTWLLGKFLLCCFDCTRLKNQKLQKHTEAKKAC